MADIDRLRVWAMTVRTLVTFIGFAIVLLAMWPLANEFAGSETTLNVTLTLSVTLAVTLVGTGIAAWGNQQRKRANRLDTRNKQLGRDVKELKRRLRDAGLDDTLSR